MNFFRIVFFSVCASLLISACKNELKLNAPYEEIPSVYAVLNPEDARHMIRINKSFLGESDANVMAKVADSINYDEGEIEVSLRRFVNGIQSSALRTNSKSDTVLIFKDSMIVTQPGAFNTNQRVYVLNRGQLHTTGEYRLRIKNLKTGNVFAAKANSLPAILPTYFPMSDFPSAYPYPAGTDPKYYVDYSNGSSVYEVKHAHNEAIIYQLAIRMHYVDSISFKEAHNLNIEMLISTRTVREAQKVGGTSYMSHTFTGNVLFGGVGGELSKHKYNLLGRRMFAIEYVVYNSSQEYQDYMEYVKPSLSISQTKPLYSNFEGQKALGIFTFRNRAQVKKNIANPYMTAYARNPATCNYKIYDSKLNQPGCN